jgi:hypothetical protein
MSCVSMRRLIIGSKAKALSRLCVGRGTFF